MNDGISVCLSLSFRIRSSFFFSSRRRHTRLQGDWSSDVCSSDLAPARVLARERLDHARQLRKEEVDERPRHEQIGRASCRERVEVSEGGGGWKEKAGRWGTHGTMNSECAVGGG